MNPILQRKQAILKVIKNPDYNLTFKESLEHVYYWVRLEMALNASYKAAKLLTKYAKLLNTNQEVYLFRKDINSL